MPLMPMQPPMPQYYPPYYPWQQFMPPPLLPFLSVSYIVPSSLANFNGVEIRTKANTAASSKGSH